MRHGRPQPTDTAASRPTEKYNTRVSQVETLKAVLHARPKCKCLVILNHKDAFSQNVIPYSFLLVFIHT